MKPCVSFLLVDLLDSSFPIHRSEDVGFFKTDNNDLDVVEFFRLPSTVSLRVVSFALQLEYGTTLLREDILSSES